MVFMSVSMYIWRTWLICHRSLMPYTFKVKSSSVTSRERNHGFNKFQKLLCFYSVRPLEQGTYPAACSDFQFPFVSLPVWHGSCVPTDLPARVALCCMVCPSGAYCCCWQLWIPPIISSSYLALSPTSYICLPGRAPISSQSQEM